jgi:ribosomal protein S18 acetylase RimI-like enzyme
LAESSLIYRRPTPVEAEAMAALHVQCWREAYGAFLPAALMASFSVEKRLPMWQAVIPHVDRFVLGVFDQDVPVGFIISGSTDEQHIENQDGHIWAIYIAEKYYRKGIGRKLIGHAAQDWMNRGGQSLTLGVLSENKTARAFYEKLGARLVKSSTYDWDGQILPDCIYVFDDLASLIP